MSVFRNYNRLFMCGLTSLETAPISGQSQSAIAEDTIHQVKTVYLDQFGQDQDVIIAGPVDKIIHDHLHLQKLSSRWIPRLFTPFQNQERAHCSKDHLGMCQETTRTFWAD
nr:uncharacterized protein LOC113805732 [Penaeus vannamei]